MTTTLAQSHLFFPTSDHHHHCLLPDLCAHWCGRTGSPPGATEPRDRGWGAQRTGVARGLGIGVARGPHSTPTSSWSCWAPRACQFCLSCGSVHNLSSLQTNPLMLCFNHINQGKIKIHKHNLARLPKKKGMTF